jgi:hypothetical protein
VETEKQVSEKRMDQITPKGIAHLRLKAILRGSMSDTDYSSHLTSIPIGRSYIQAFENSEMFSKVHQGPGDFDFALEINHVKVEAKPNITYWLNTFSFGIIPGYKENTIRSSISIFNKEGERMHACELNYRIKTYMGWIIIPLGGYSRCPKI